MLNPNVTLILRKRFIIKILQWGNKDRVSKKNPQGGTGGGYSLERPRCTTCGNQHLGKFLDDIHGCFGCGIIDIR